MINCFILILLGAGETVICDDCKTESNDVYEMLEAYTKDPSGVVICVYCKELFMLKLKKRLVERRKADER